MPRFFKLYIILSLLVVMLLVCLITLTGSLPFITTAHDSLPADSLADGTEKIVSFDGAFIPQDTHNNHHAPLPPPLPKPDHNGDTKSDEEVNEVDNNLFNFQADDTNHEISWELDLLPAVHTAKQNEVIEAMKHSWSAYRTSAWGADHLRPLTKTKQNWFNVGLTILDSVDTLLLMGMKAEFEDAMDWIENQLTFDIYKDVNCFEMTIRVLGGLQSAFHLTKKPSLLAKAVDVGDRLIHCFDSPSGVVPFSDVNLKTKAPKSPAWSPESSLSEVSTMQLEFRDLSRLIREDKFEKISFKTSEHIHSEVLKTGDSLLPMYINPNTGRFGPSTITLGARGDSYYEYLLKQYLQTGIEWLAEDYLNAVDAIKSRLIKSTLGPKKLTYVAELLRNKEVISPKMDHLVCFLPGTLALGHFHYSKSKPSGHRGHNVNEDVNHGRVLSDRFESHLVLAEELARTCYEMYNMTATGLSPEIVYFGVTSDEEEIYVRPADSHNLLRPEYVESLFYLYHITGNQMYRDQGSKVSVKLRLIHTSLTSVCNYEQILAAFNKYSRVASGGYTTIDDVRNAENTRPKNMMESFWLAETLKYLYLLFSDDKTLISKMLNHYVFNTEAHLIPLKVKS